MIPADEHTKKLERRIHNQRVRLRQVETFAAHPSYKERRWRLWFDYAVKLSKKLRTMDEKLAQARAEGFREGRDAAAHRVETMTHGRGDLEMGFALLNIARKIRALEPCEASNDVGENS